MGGIQKTRRQGRKKQTHGQGFSHQSHAREGGNKKEKKDLPKGARPLSIPGFEKKG